MIGLLDALRGVADRHVVDMERLVNTYLTLKNVLEPLPRNEILKHVRNGLVTVLDVRPPEEYTAVQVPGAVNIPLSDLKHYLDKLNPKQEIIAYCRGPHCVPAFDAMANQEKNI